MNVLYLTNRLVKDKNVIPSIIKDSGDTVFFYDTRISLDDLKNNNIDFFINYGGISLSKKCF